MENFVQRVEEERRYREEPLDLNGKVGFSGDLDKDILGLVKGEIGEKVPKAEQVMKYLLGNYFDGGDLKEVWGKLAERGCKEVVVEKGEFRFYGDLGEIAVKDLSRGERISVFGLEGEVEKGMKEKILDNSRKEMMDLMREIGGF